MAAVSRHLGRRAIATIRMTSTSLSPTRRPCGPPTSGRKRWRCWNKPRSEIRAACRCWAPMAGHWLRPGNINRPCRPLDRAHTPDNPDWRILNVQGAVLDQMGRHADAQTALRVGTQNRARRTYSAFKSRPFLSFDQGPEKRRNHAAARGRAEKRRAKSAPKSCIGCRPARSFRRSGENRQCRFAGERGGRKRPLPAADDCATA